MKVNYWKLHAAIATAGLALLAGNTVYTAFAGPLPHMTPALHILGDAFTELNKAPQDTAGHRNRALGAIMVAISEIKASNSENEHPLVDGGTPFTPVEPTPPK